MFGAGLAKEDKMATETGPLGGDNTGNAVLLEAVAGEPVTLPAGFSLAGATFSRTGTARVLTVPGGTQGTDPNPCKSSTSTMTDF